MSFPDLFQFFNGTLQKWNDKKSALPVSRELRLAFMLQRNQRYAPPTNRGWHFY